MRKFEIASSRHELMVQGPSGMLYLRLPMVINTNTCVRKTHMVLGYLLTPRQAIVGGILVGGIAQFLASPADLIKVQMQMEGKRRLEGHAPRIHSAGEAFIKIYNAGGLRGLWKGCMPNVYRSAFVNLGDLTTYDSVKRYFVNTWALSDDYWTHALSSACSGLIGATMGTPVDVVKTRVMNQPTDDRARGLLYRNSLDCLLKTVHNEGFWALYKGFIPCWLRMGPWSLTFWLTYEQIRNLSGTSAF
ncbi:hypothetical protein OTU49_006518 [Cherax quadricarinatus]|uniref:Mitochondrial uncoupling protein 4 n=1 Tax=Cherax quadricarinatus TaxID=27406 RepID=A0AAW0X1V9_CHEQU